MKSQHITRRLLPYTVAILLTCLVIGFAMGPRLARAVAQDPVTAAWEKARAAGAYRFDSDLTQTTIPSPTVVNVGRSSRVQTLHLSGQTNLRQQTLEMQLWTGSGSVLDGEGSLGVKVEDGKSFVRSQGPAGWGDWQETDSAFDGFAPQGDFLAFLAAARDIQAHPPEVRRAGGREIAFTRYSFTLDGPAYAAYMRDHMEQALRARGELPPGMHLQASAYHRDMRGTGELWVRADGLPLRQILNLTFPEQRGEFVTAQMTVDFSDFGGAETPLPALIRSGDLTGLAAALPHALPDLMPLVTVMAALTGVVLVVRFRRARVLQHALACAVITSMLVGPILQTWQVDSYFSAQAARAAQEEQTTSDDIRQTLGGLDGNTGFDPHTSLLAAASQRPEIVGASIASTAAAVQSAGAQALVDNGVDSDSDGLTDFAEARVGTDPAVADSDGDGLTDGEEVRGFSFAGRMWYTNPNTLDSNDDGIPDGTEWGFDANGNRRTIPPDTDADGTPDLFDADNDNDRVPDRLDLSARAKSAATFTENRPFNLTIRNLTPGKPTFVDFQIRPTTETHLWFAFNVLDWPRGDDQGQVTDIDGGTYADLSTTADYNPTPNEAYGDMKLIPMLEVRIDASNGQATNLPAQSELTPYGIIVNNLTADGSRKVAYVPLSLVTDTQGGERAAFAGRMYYLPGGDWPAAHEVRLAWVVQALVDLGCDNTAPDQVAAGCAADGYFHNVPQVVQSYYDDWTLTGLNVSEQHGATTAIIYEDPQQDSDLNDDTPLVALSHALDETLLGARDADNDDERDVDIDAIAANLANLSANWDLSGFFAVTSGEYATFDQATMYTAMTETVTLLDTTFDPVLASNPNATPTLMYTYEQTSRGISLDTLLAESDQFNVRLDFDNMYMDFEPPSQPPVETVTVAGLKWVHYCADGPNAAWEVCPAEEYWQTLDQRFAGGVLPGDPTDPDVQAGRVVLMQLYDQALSRGVSNVVQRDNQLVSANYTLKSDPALANTFRSAAGTGRMAAVFIANTALMSNINNVGFVEQIGLVFRPMRGGVVEGAYALRNITNPELRGSAVVLGVKVLYVAGLITAAVLAASAGGQDAQIALRAFVIGIQFYFGVLDPILAATKWASALQAAGSTTSIARSGTEVLGISKTANAIGTVIAIAIVWGFFIYSMAANNVSPLSPEFNQAFAETIAATIYLVLLALISATVIGLILVGIISLIDTILTAICELGVDDLRKVPGLDGACFTLGTAAIKAIAYALYNYDVMIDTARNNLVEPGAPQTTLADPSRGFVAGNAISITMPITTNIVHKSPDPASGLMINLYLYFFSRSNLRSTTFKYSLSQPEPEKLSAGRNTMSGDWQNVREHHLYAATPMYAADFATTPGAVSGFNLPAGINQTAPFYLNMGFALPAYECWIIPTPFVYPAPICYTRTFASRNSTKIETLHYDIFPPTLAGFLALAVKPDSGVGLAWDSRFPSLADADGDGLLSNVYGGIDPNDDPATRGWDTDRDGLTDANEMERRAAGLAFSPIQCDTDGDGLTDAQEAQFGTNPANRDTDNDGLSDDQEIYHLVYNTTTCQPTATMAGGWNVTINAAVPFTARATSDPLRADSDADGISDLAERQLAQDPDPAKRLDDENRPYHPRVLNSAPLAVYPSVDRPYVRPGGAVRYTATVVADVAMAPSILDVTLPSVFGPSPAPLSLDFDPLTFSDIQTVTQQINLTAQSGLPTQEVTIGSDVRARLADTGAATPAWDALIPQTLGSATRPVRFSGAAASLPDRTDSFLTSALLSSSDAREGEGAIQTNAIPGGQSGQLENGNNNDDALRGATAPEVACNDGGVCMVVWDQHERCTMHTIEYLEVVDAGGEGEIEPVIYWIADYNDTNPADGGYELVWNPLTNGIRDLRANIRVGPDANGFPIEIEVCGEGRIDIYEADTETITDNPSNLDLIGSSLRVVPGNFAYPNGTWWLYTRSGIQTEVSLFESMPRMNLDTVRGALVGPTGNVLRSSFAIPAALPTSQANSHNFQPAVASDGVNFLVVSELADETNFDTYLDIRLFDPAGNLIGQPTAQQISTNRLAIGPREQGVALDVAWIGDRYLVAYKFMSKNNEPRTIFIRNFDAAGSPLGAGWTTATTQAVPTASRPALAYNPRNGETLLLYLNQGGGLRRILYDGAHLAPVLGDDYLYQENSTLPMGFAGYSSPLVSYNPMVDGWLISGARVTALGGSLYSLWRRDLSSRLVSDQVLPLLPVTNYNTQAQACPADTALPAVALRFEERPGATTFVDSSRRGNHATCSSGACLIAALPGAVDNLGNAVGTPASDFAVRFDGSDDRLTLPNPIDQTFTIAFWYKANATNQWDPFTIDGGSGGFALRIYNTMPNVELYSGNTIMQANTSTLANKVLYDGEWHFVVATRNAAGALALYIDGNATPVKTQTNADAPAHYSTLGILGGGTAVELDQFQLYTTALSGATVNDLYERTLQSYCVGTRYHENVYQWLKLNMSTPDVRGGKLTTGAQLAVTIDGDRPTSTIEGLRNGQYIRGNTIHTIGGTANDATSGAAGVDVNINGAGFVPANGAAAWAYNLTVTEGSYSIQSRATDVAGNVETPGPGIAVIADGTPPVVAYSSPGAAPVVPGQDGNGQWFITLSGTAQDPQSGGQPGSGVQPDSVQVLLVAQAGDDTAQGNGWQQATLNGGTWTLDYQFAAGLGDPTGRYDVFVRAADHVGNRTADDVAVGTLQLDLAGPVAVLSVADAAREVITDTITIRGIITDTGAAGVQGVQVSFVPLEQIAALPADVGNDEAAALLDAAGRVWLPASVANAGAVAGAWTAQIPADLEGEYQLDLRGTDGLGNQGISPNLWRGVIDTRAPRLVIDAQQTNATFVHDEQQYTEFIFTCIAEDRYLVEQEFLCEGNAYQPPERFFTEDASVQALFPDRVILSKLVNTYARWEENLPPSATVSACDAFGRCSTATNSQTSVADAQGAVQAASVNAPPVPGTPKAVIVSPGNLRYVAATAALPVTVAAEAAQGVQAITLLLDGNPVGTITFAPDETVTRVQRTFTIPTPAVGSHTLAAQATAVGGETGATLYPVTIYIDAQPPTLTLDTDTLTVADTWQPGSGIVRFRGTAGDDVGLSAVKVQVDNQPFVNALFGGGNWSIALPVLNPEGREIPVVVRAFDFAGQITQVDGKIPGNLSAADAPDTAITSGPGGPSDVNAATFTFTGTAGGRAVVGFECQLNGGAFAPCSSPWNVTDLLQGSNTFRVRAVDEGGFVDLTPASVAWTVNAPLLAVAITAAPESSTSSRTATFAFQGGAGVVGFDCALDDGQYVACDSPQIYTKLGDGPHTFTVRGRDGAGNRGAAAQHLWTITNVPPVAGSLVVNAVKDRSVEITLPAVDSDALTFELVTLPAHGFVQFIAANVVRYTPDSAFSGIDQFSFRAGDGRAYSQPTTVEIFVSGSATDSAVQIVESFTVSHVEEGKVTGTGSRACYWITLASNPGSGSVVVNVGPPNRSQVMPNKSFVVLDASNWNNLSTGDSSNFVCILPVHDAIDDGGAQICYDGNSDMLGNGTLVTDKECGDHEDTIPHRISSATAPGYATNTPIQRKQPDGTFAGESNVPVLVQDDDTAGVVLTESFGVSDLDEDGSPVGLSCYWVTLTSQPTAPVTVQALPDNNQVQMQGAASVTLDGSNWDVLGVHKLCLEPKQEREVDGTPNQYCADKKVDLYGAGPVDTQVCGSHLGAVDHSVTSSDARYNDPGVPVHSNSQDVGNNGARIIDVLVRDDEVPGLVFTPAALNTLEGATVPYTVMLSAAPKAAVEVTAAGGVQAADAAAAAVTLVFTPENWNVPQELTITLPDDQQVNGVRTSGISHNVVSSDPAFNGLSAGQATLPMTVTDDDAAGAALSRGSVRVAEGGAGDGYTLRLTVAPAADVVVTVDGGGQVAAGPSQLTFTPENWNVAQSVTLTALDDLVDEGDWVNVTVRHTASSSDPVYQGAAIADLLAEVTDNDTAALAVSRTAAGRINEGERTEYTVTLATQPAAAVQVFVITDGKTTATPNVLTFDAGNWNAAQLVTLTGADDDEDNNANVRTSLVTHVAVSGDGAYHSLVNDGLSVEVIDNDVAGIRFAVDNGSTDNVNVGSGGQASVGVTLATRPRSTVVLEIDPSVGVAVAPNCAAETTEGLSRCFVFTPENWNVAQLLTLTALSDNPAYVDHRAASADTRYNGLGARLHVNGIGGPDNPVFLPLVSQ